MTTLIFAVGSLILGQYCDFWFSETYPTELQAEIVH